MLILVGCACTEQSQPVYMAEKEPVVIAVIDTGFSSRAIPRETIIEGKNYCNPEMSTEDTFGHGTAVASIILDIAPDVRLIPLVSNVYDDGKMLQVDHATLAQIIRDAVDVYHCDIINISAGLSQDQELVRDAIAYAEEKNVLVVAAAGNDYAQNGEVMYYPAAYETVLAVGSLNSEEGEISEFSQRGDWVNLYVCGEEIIVKTLSGNTRMENGTSYSAAKISGYAAQLISKEKKSLTAHQLRERIYSCLQ